MLRWPSGLGGWRRGHRALRHGGAAVVAPIKRCRWPARRLGKNRRPATFAGRGWGKSSGFTDRGRIRAILSLWSRRSETINEAVKLGAAVLRGRCPASLSGAILALRGIPLARALPKVGLALLRMPLGGFLLWLPVPASATPAGSPSPGETCVGISILGVAVAARLVLRPGLAPGGALGSWVAVFRLTTTRSLTPSTEAPWVILSVLCISVTWLRPSRSALGSVVSGARAVLGLALMVVAARGPSTPGETPRSPTPVLCIAVVVGVGPAGLTLSLGSLGTNRPVFHVIAIGLRPARLALTIESLGGDGPLLRFSIGIGI
mmetsp:Transcript_39826/g.86935  ORF Transcript_39826/g.86935 Transcript_39826/m.86935 type:complete len:319 (+) Transcript_39826:1316-2272(+)